MLLIFFALSLINTAICSQRERSRQDQCELTVTYIVPSEYKDYPVEENISKLSNDVGRHFSLSVRRHFDRDVKRIIENELIHLEQHSFAWQRYLINKLLKLSFEYRAKNTAKSYPIKFISFLSQRREIFILTTDTHSYHFSKNARWVTLAIYRNDILKTDIVTVE